jgi:hypothetical protein
VQFAGRTKKLYERHLLFDKPASPPRWRQRATVRGPCRSVRDILPSDGFEQKTYEQQNSKRLSSRWNSS